jgi:hypothetical protein
VDGKLDLLWTRLQPKWGSASYMYTYRRCSRHRVGQRHGALSIPLALASASWAGLDVRRFIKLQTASAYREAETLCSPCEPIM